MKGLTLLNLIIAFILIFFSGYILGLGHSQSIDIRSKIIHLQ
jgi:hypothetical protein